MHLHDTLHDLAGVTPPARLEALALLLSGGSHALLDPTETSGIHPLVVPLARDELGAVLGLLRWPTPPENMPLPLVRQQGAQLRLVATSVDAWLHAELAHREARGEELGGLARAANAVAPLYEPGQRAQTGLPLNAYLLTRVGVSSDFFEELIDAHFSRGDVTAALVTADRGCRDSPGWARPLAIRARAYDRAERPEEAADSARLSLLQPLWTLGEDPTPTTRLAGWAHPPSGAPFRLLAGDSSKPVLDRAAHLLDAVCAEGGDWDGVRPALAALYREAGLDGLAAFVDR